MISISVSNLAFRTGTREILAGVTFSLEEGDRLAIVGVNGSGKSTLLKMICGDYPHDEGEIYIARNKTLGMISAGRRRALPICRPGWTARNRRTRKP